MKEETQIHEVFVCITCMQGGRLFQEEREIWIKIIPMRHIRPMHLLMENKIVNNHICCAIDVKFARLRRVSLS